MTHESAVVLAEAYEGATTVIAGLAEVDRKRPTGCAGRDDAAYLRKATGRRRLTDAERASQGASAARLPLLGRPRSGRQADRRRPRRARR